MSEQIFFKLVYHNTSLTHTHRITYLQNSVVEKDKENSQTYSCDPAYYPIALKELMKHFVDPINVANASINQLEAWRPKSVPKMELQAAVIGVRLLQLNQREMTLTFNRIDL